MGLIENGLKWLGEQRRKADGVSITYVRGSLSCVISDAVVDIGEVQIIEGDIIRTIETREYLIAPASLVLGGDVTEPRRGDKIEEVRGSVTLRQELMDEKGMPAWDYDDPGRTLLRVRTKKVA